jgi:hypothetical protein
MRAIALVDGTERGSFKSWMFKGMLAVPWIGEGKEGEFRGREEEFGHGLSFVAGRDDDPVRRAAPLSATIRDSDDVSAKASGTTPPLIQGGRRPYALSAA